MPTPSPDRGPMTLTEKILLAHAIGWDRPYVAPGDEIQIAVDWTIASELAWNGRHDDGSRATAGVYFYRLEMKGRVVSRRLVLLRPQ